MRAPAAAVRGEKREHLGVDDDSQASGPLPAALGCAGCSVFWRRGKALYERPEWSDRTAGLAVCGICLGRLVHYAKSEVTPRYRRERELFRLWADGTPFPFRDPVLPAARRRTDREIHDRVRAAFRVLLKQEPPANAGERKDLLRRARLSIPREERVEIFQRLEAKLREQSKVPLPAPVLRKLLGALRGGELTAAQRIMGEWPRLPAEWNRILSRIRYPAP